MTFDECFDRLIGHEGAYDNNPKDRGNWTSGVIGNGRLKGTKWGVSAAAYPNLDIENLNLQDAKAIYRRDYWTPAGCDVVHPLVKFHLFDMAVNGGVRAAIRAMQRAAHEVEDGVIGPKTQAALERIEPLRLVARMSGARLEAMTHMQEAWKEFGKGWARRIAANLQEA